MHLFCVIFTMSEVKLSKLTDIFLLSNTFYIQLWDSKETPSLHGIKNSSFLPYNLTIEWIIYWYSLCDVTHLFLRLSFGACCGRMPCWKFISTALVNQSFCLCLHFSKYHLSHALCMWSRSQLCDLNFMKKADVNWATCFVKQTRWTFMKTVVDCNFRTHIKKNIPLLLNLSVIYLPLLLHILLLRCRP